MDIAGKVAVVTGASRGIGRAIAVALAQAGVDVVCTARSTEAHPHKVLPGTIEETARQVQALGRRTLAIPVDVSKEEEVEAIARRVLAEFGRAGHPGEQRRRRRPRLLPGSTRPPLGPGAERQPARSLPLCPRLPAQHDREAQRAASSTCPLMPHTPRAPGAGLLGVQGGHGAPHHRPGRRALVFGHRRERSPNRAICDQRGLCLPVPRRRLFDLGQAGDGGGSAGLAGEPRAVLQRPESSPPLGAPIEEVQQRDSSLRSE